MTSEPIIYEFLYSKAWNMLTGKFGTTCYSTTYLRTPNEANSERKGENKFEKYYQNRPHLPSSCTNLNNFKSKRVSIVGRLQAWSTEGLEFRG